jgi:hypothetical protein
MPLQGYNCSNATFAVYRLYDLCSTDIQCMNSFHISGKTVAYAQEVFFATVQTFLEEKGLLATDLCTAWLDEACYGMCITPDWELTHSNMSYSCYIYSLMLVELLSTQDMCLPNRQYDPDAGCVCEPGKICDEADASQHLYDIVSFNSFIGLVFIVFIVANAYGIKRISDTEGHLQVLASLIHEKEMASAASSK